MFYLLAKGFWLLSAPSNLLTLLFGLSVLLLARGFRLGGLICGGAALVLAVLCWAGLGQLLLQPLENRFPAEPKLACLDGIVLLGGGEDVKTSGQRGLPVLTAGAGRMAAAAELMRRFPQARLVFTGSAEPEGPAGTSETATALDALDRLGADPARVTAAASSRDTWENFTAMETLRAETLTGNWVLVTSARHMPRSIAISRRLGWRLIPWPADYRTAPQGLVHRAYFVEALDELEQASREWVGLLAYRLAGRTETLLPARDVPPALPCPSTKG